jgi:hypothetical protein
MKLLATTMNMPHWLPNTMREVLLFEAMGLSQGHSYNRYAWLVNPNPNTLTFNDAETRQIGIAASVIAKCVVALGLGKWDMNGYG